MSSTFVTLFAALVFAPLPFPKPGTAKADLAIMQGQWDRVSFVAGGEAHDVTANPTTATVTGDRVSYGTPDDHWRMVLEATHFHRRINFHRVRPLGGTDLVVGLYRLEGTR